MPEDIVRQGDWLEAILAKEKKAHRDFFGQEFDLASFRKTLERYNPEAISHWQKLGLEPHFLPSVAMSQEDNFPGWKVKLENWYYQQVADGKVLRCQPDGNLLPNREAFKLEGITVLVDIRLKPRYKAGKQMFKNDNLLGHIIEGLRKAGKIPKYEYGPQSSRFGVSANEWEEHIKPTLAEFLGVEVSQVRLERAIEANVISQLYPSLPRRDDDKTTTWVWYEDSFGAASCRLHGGVSRAGALSLVRCYWADFFWTDLAFRPLVVLGD